MDEEYCVIDKDVETKMKRLALAGSIIAFTFILGILAVAVAQRDARQRSEEKRPFALIILSSSPIRFSPICLPTRSN